MNELPIAIYQAARKYQPITTNGLTLYPVLVKEYRDFALARPAIEVLQQSFPVALLRMPLLAAMYRMDYDAAMSGTPAAGLFLRALLALALALRLGAGEPAEERIRMFRIEFDREQPEKLLRLHFTDESGTSKEIAPAQFQTLRRIIAAQNGVRLESDKANPDIVQAQKDMASGGIQLEGDEDDLICAVAALSGTDEAKIDEWPILKLEKRAESYRRVLSYLVCGIGELSGATWKNGNPAPHPFFKRMQGGDGLMRPLDSEQKQMPSAVKQLIQESKNL